MRLGPLNWVIAGPELHRSHHSADVAESNHNYGNNLIIIDVLLGTRHLPRTAPSAIGLPAATRFANTFIGHLLLPLTLGRPAEVRNDVEEALR
jgi:sterol desaturase/sphingolipid hydroxylase (fatty acid hydroxylase superfamily)